MKKIILTVAFVATTMFANANYAKINSNVMVIDDFKLELVQDSVSNEKRISGIVNLKEDLNYNYNIAFYDVERIVITNTKGAAIMIVDNGGRVVVETNDSVDINVPAGNYKVYSSAKIDSKMFTW